MSASDQAYVVQLVSEILAESPLEEYRGFDWLKGDAGTVLPVDAYFPEHQLVLEYRERQHLADRADTFRLWDNKPTASGIPRRKQRARYDALRDREISAHNLHLLIVTPDELAHDSRGRLRRDRDVDRETLRTMMGS